MSAGRELAAAARPETLIGKAQSLGYSHTIGGCPAPSETLWLSDPMAFGGPCGIQRPSSGVAAVANGAGYIYICLVSGAMRSAITSTGDGSGWRLAKARQADCERFALAGVPVLSDQFRELARGILIPGSERDDGLDEGACDAFSSLRGGGQDEGELVEVRRFDEIEGMLCRYGRVGDDLVDLLHGQTVGQVKDGQVLPAGSVVAIAGEQIRINGAAASAADATFTATKYIALGISNSGTQAGSVVFSHFTS